MAGGTLFSPTAMWCHFTFSQRWIVTHFLHLKNTEQLEMYPCYEVSLLNVPGSEEWKEKFWGVLQKVRLAPREKLAELDRRWLRSLKSLAAGLGDGKGCWSRKSCGAQLPMGSNPQRRNSSKYHSNEHRPLTISKPFASAVSSRLNCNFSNERTSQRSTLALASVIGHTVKHEAGGASSPVFANSAENPGREDPSSPRSLKETPSKNPA